MIVICGDSWACGEHAFNNEDLFKDTPKDLTQYYRDKSRYHLGLEQYLKKDGYEVVNVGFRGASNLGGAIALRSALNVLTRLNKVTTASITIICFQTEWWRDLSEYQHPITGIPNLREALSEALTHKSIDYWLNQLVSIAKDYNVKINLVGGASDTIWSSNFEQQYLGLSILCQSLTNLCVNNNSRIDDPVFGINPELLVSTARPLCCSKEDLEYLTRIIDQGLKRFELFDTHLEYFWPDGGHANRAGHRKLYELVKEKLLERS